MHIWCITALHYCAAELRFMSNKLIKHSHDDNMPAKCPSSSSNKNSPNVDFNMFLLQAAIEDFKTNTTAIAVFWAGGYYLTMSITQPRPMHNIFSKELVELGALGSGCRYESRVLWDRARNDYLLSRTHCVQDLECPWVRLQKQLSKTDFYCSDTTQIIISCLNRKHNTYFRFRLKFFC